MDAIIIGGGIGGSALALALHASGVARRIRVFEAAAEMRALGIGIHIGAHAMKELSALGLEEALAATSCQPEAYATLLDIRLGLRQNLFQRLGALGDHEYHPDGAPSWTCISSALGGGHSSHHSNE